MDDHTFDLGHDHTHIHTHDDQVTHDDAAEAVLASLRAVINDPSNSHAHAHAHTTTDGVEGEEELVNTHTHGDVVDEDTLERYVHDQDDDEEVPEQAQAETSTSDNDTSQMIITIVEKGLSSLNAQIKNDKSILDELNSPNAIQNLAKNLKILNENNQKNLELIKNLNDQLKFFGRGDGVVGTEDNQHLISAFTTAISDQSPFVLRSEYDALKSRYDALTAGKKERKPKSSNKQNQQQGHAVAAEASLQALKESQQDSAGYQLGGVEGRKKRSIKLEHLVHQKANRRLGVEYQVTNFDSKGSRELPDPTSEATKAENSINGVDEFRPDFKSELNAPSVKPFIDQVVQDCIEAWQGGVLNDEPEIDVDRITNSVHIYWTRLCKRYDEQLHRERGEIHRDEISRRKQNTYRRQQSLLARRLAAFDSSPLNVCKLRALYRTLLTIDFAAPTQDSPDPKRDYTEEEWKAYRKLACGSRAAEAHEVIDQFWLSSMARQLLIILDVYSADMTARARKKGRPKQPNPTFHLPSQLWDRSTLPTIRPKDASGLPIAGAQGIVLFKFHVDETVQKENPEWAKGLYDNPPIPDEDTSLPGLPDVMSMGIYTSLKSQLKDAKDKSDPKVLSADEVEEVNNRVMKPDDAIEIDQSILDNSTLNVELSITPQPQPQGESSDTTNPIGTGEGDYTTFLALNRLNGLSSTPNTDPLAPTSSTSPIQTAFTIPTHTNPLTGLSGIGEHSVGPSPGSSMRARKLGKRSVSEVPGGAATPVPKRRKPFPKDTNTTSTLMLDNSLSLEGNEFVNSTDDVELGNAEDDDDDDDKDRAVDGEVQGDAAFLDGL
ncbi:hypothetical protein I302_103984 [Kwoniella bestiolae CBS 10118]|uniref:Uncharacterized protein n=1 Tax=Kwoniella bestiolae CBS 10118 TaxID=1296100 RepID=A0A1B9GA33_9TREE|nr:hypothetical protein I302_02689 [Kwoniella bestiolae CBS 10118]OCF27840.1 hypothetical protein I302_02689 [Kwoniella bestiolae CBS 10118]